VARRVPERAPPNAGSWQRRPATTRDRQRSDKALDWKRSTTAGGRTTDLFLGKKASAMIPVVMSLTALALVGMEISIHGMGAERDEGALAHLYQLLVVGQLPIILFFVFRWLRRAPTQGLRVVVAQVRVGGCARAGT